MAEREEELTSLLMKVKEESEKAGLKLNIRKTKTMAPGPITSWEIDGETRETVRDFIFSSVQSFSCVRLSATPWIAASQASLSITNSLQMVTKDMKLKDAYSLEEKLWPT